MYEVMSDWELGLRADLTNYDASGLDACLTYDVGHHL